MDQILKSCTAKIKKVVQNFFSAARTCDRFALRAKRSQALAAGVDIRKTIIVSHFFYQTCSLLFTFLLLCFLKKESIREIKRKEKTFYKRTVSRILFYWYQHSQRALATASREARSGRKCERLKKNLDNLFSFPWTTFSKMGQSIHLWIPKWIWTTAIFENYMYTPMTPQSRE